MLEVLIKFHCNFLGRSQSFRVLLLVNILRVAENWQEGPVHYRKPFGLTPGNPFVNLSLLELTVAIETCLRIESGDVLSYCLCIEDSFIFSDKVRIFLNQSWSLLIVGQANV